MKQLKRRNFRLFPGRLPQSWMALSHGAQGMAFHWWRVFEDEPVRIPEARLSASLGMQPEARRYAKKWLDEMLEAEAVTRSSDGYIRMQLMLPTDAGRTLDERSEDAGRTLDERSEDAGRTLDERSSLDKRSKPLGADVQKPAYTDIQTDIQTTRAREKPSAALKAALEEQVRSAYFRVNSGSQMADDARWLDGCKRVQDAVAQGHFPSLDAACRALAEAAVAESLKPNGKLGFALQQAAFVAAPEPKTREYSREDLRPRKQHPEVA